MRGMFKNTTLEVARGAGAVVKAKQRHGIAEKTAPGYWVPQLKEEESLPPAPGYEHPSASGPAIVWRYPTRARPWRKPPFSRTPNVTATVPAVKTLHPNVSGTRRNTHHPDVDRRWRSNPDHHLGAGYSRSQ